MAYKKVDIIKHSNAKRFAVSSAGSQALRKGDPGNMKKHTKGKHRKAKFIRFFILSAGQKER
jgi:hypothetical protein